MSVGIIVSCARHYEGTSLLTAQGCLRLPGQPVRTLESLVWTALNHDLDGLWIAPGSVESCHAAYGPTDIFFESMTTETQAIACRSHIEGGKITCIHAWRREGTPEERRTIRVLFPEHDERWGLQDKRNPRELLGCIDLLENALGVALDWSPGSTGVATLRRLNKGPRSSWIAPIDFTGTPWAPTEEEQADGAQVPLSGSGTRKVFPDLSTLDVTVPMFFHTYDKGYGFGGAMTSVTIGDGDPVYVGGGLRSPWNPKFPGLWRCPGGRWLYTPEMHYLLTEGYLDVSQIDQGYVWPQYHQTMRSFADLFWGIDIATVSHPCARAVAKRIRSQGFGWLAMDTRAWRETPDRVSSGLYRPDIWGAVVSELRSKMNYTMNALWRKGYNAVWWNCDELGFFSNDPDPRTAVPILGREGIGAFRHRYSLRVDDDILLAFAPDVFFFDAHALLLSKWHAQQRMHMDQTLLVPAVRAHG